MTEIEVRNVDELIFRKDLYPRIETSAITVQQYADSLDMLPPIEINQHNELIDGWHRWTAHKKAKVDTIKVFVTETKSDTHLLELAVERNATHGLQLSQDDKRDIARRIYHITPERERDKKKKHLAKILSVPDRTLRDWLSRIDKDAKDARDRRIFDLYRACYTQEEIAETVGVSRGEVAKSVPNGNSAVWNNPSALHLVDFEVPLYNVWKFKEKSRGTKHFGNSEPTILDNLLYLYTKPFDIVVDPFAGGGSTIEVCKKRWRRYWVADKMVPPEWEGRIRQHDIVNDGLPGPSRWGGVRLVYLDPPYWKQAEGRYSNDSTDLANMPLEDFNHTLSGLIDGLAKKMKAGGHIALLMQPTQWNAEGHHYTDHVADMLRLVKLPIAMRVQCPYESQQATAQMVEWAKANRQLLVLSRELIIWEVK